jgi:hypothetical protein
MTILVTLAALDETTVIDGTPNKIIVVRSILLSAATSNQAATVRLKSESSILTPWLRIGATGTLQFESGLGQIQTERGQALRVENPLAVDGATLLITYEVKD